MGVELVVVHVVAPTVDVPIPNATGTVVVGLRLVSVTAMVPDCVTEKTKTLDTCAARVPENVSVTVATAVGDVASSEKNPQPDSSTTMHSKPMAASDNRDCVVLFARRLNHRRIRPCLTASFFPSEELIASLCRPLHAFALGVCAEVALASINSV